MENQTNIDAILIDELKLKLVSLKEDLEYIRGCL